MQRSNSVCATDMLVADEYIWDSSLPSLLKKVVLNLSTLIFIRHLIQFEYDRFRLLVGYRSNELLGPP